MGKMKLYLAVLFLVVKGTLGFCPSLCTCKGNRSGEGVSESQPKDLLKLSCGGTSVQITELKEIDLTKLWMDVVSLNLSGNAISTLSRELHLPNLQKLVPLSTFQRHRQTLDIICEQSTCQHESNEPKLDRVT